MLAVLLVGGHIHIFSDMVAHNPAVLLEQVDRHGISIFETVPSLLRAMLEVYEAIGVSRASSEGAALVDPHRGSTSSRLVSPLVTPLP